MGHPRYSDAEIGRRGKELYDHSIRAQVEIPENIGKMLAIDIETGDYEIGGNTSIEASQHLRARHPDAAIYAHRIGYNVAVSLGGVMERTTR